MDRRWDKSKPPQGPFTLNRDCPQAQGIVAWWPMGNASGSVLLLDEAGKYHLSGSASGMTIGPSGAPSASFNGSSSYLSNAAAPSNMPLTLAAWATPNSASLVGTILSVDNGDDSGQLFRMVVVGTASPKEIRANHRDTISGEANASYGAGWVSGTEFHGAAVFTSTSSRAIYYNGALGISNSTVMNSLSVSRVQMGRNQSSAARQYWSGTIGESGVWNVALSADNIRRLYDQGTRFELWYPLRSRKWFTQGGAGDASAALTGSAVTSSAGTLTPSLEVALSGQAVTSSAGTITPGVGVDVALTGEAVTSSAGTLTAATSIALAGQAVTSSAGTLTANNSVSLSGQAVTVSDGTITPSLGTDVALSGEAVASAAGTLSVSTSVALSGESVTSSTGVIGIYIPTLSSPQAFNVTQTSASLRVTLTF